MGKAILIPQEVAPVVPGSEERVSEPWFGCPGGPPTVCSHPGGWKGEAEGIIGGVEGLLSPFIHQSKGFW